MSRRTSRPDLRHTRPATATSQSKPVAQASSGWTTRLEQQVLQEVLAATYWLDSGEEGKPYSLSVKFSGSRLGVTGKPQPRDHFTQVETVEGIRPGSGPLSVTTRVHGVNPGEWLVRAEPTVRRDGGRSRHYRGPSPVTSGRKSWWRFWPPQPVSADGLMKTKTSLLPFAPIPGIFRPAWPALVGLGVLVGLAMQALLLARAHLNVGAALAVSVSACVVGAVGAKVWFLVVNRQRPSIATEGLCIQGFLVGSALVLVTAFGLLRLPIGTFLDYGAPGLLIGLALGRPGCIFGGCCTGRLTSSRWGVWTSDRRVGARRVPTQLMESALSLAIGVVALILVVQRITTQPGAVFVGALAAYTLGRQLLLPLRSEPRKSSLGRPLAMLAAGLVLIADVVRSFVA